MAGGYCDGVLAHMELFTLSLTTFRWNKCPGLMPGQGRQLPTPCQRVGTLRLTKDWLLMLGGCPEQVSIRGPSLCLDVSTLRACAWDRVAVEIARGLGRPGTACLAQTSVPSPTAKSRVMSGAMVRNEGRALPQPAPKAGSPPHRRDLQGEFLDDVHRLHLPTLTWRGPPEQMDGQAAQGVRRVAGHTLTAGLAFGGCIATVVGIVPISKTDLLLLGDPPTLRLLACLLDRCERCCCRKLPVTLLAPDASQPAAGMPGSSCPCADAYGPLRAA